MSEVRNMRHSFILFSLVFCLLIAIENKVFGSFYHGENSVGLFFNIFEVFCFVLVLALLIPVLVTCQSTCLSKCQSTCLTKYMFCIVLLLALLCPALVTCQSTCLSKYVSRPEIGAPRYYYILEVLCIVLLLEVSYSILVAYQTNYVVKLWTIPFKNWCYCSVGSYIFYISNMAAYLFVRALSITRFCYIHVTCQYYRFKFLVSITFFKLFFTTVLCMLSCFYSLPYITQVMISIYCNIYIPFHRVIFLNGECCYIKLS